MAESGHVGGLVGWNKGVVTGSFAQGSITGGNTTGGFVGSNFGSIYKSYATGHVMAGYTAGGFAGSSGTGSELQNCYATGDVIATEPNSGAYFGGFAGSIAGKVQNCVSTGTLTPGWSYNGGFAGSFDGVLYSFDENFVTLKNCFGNCETSLDTTVKALGNYVDGLDEHNNQAAAAIGATQAQAKEKLKEMLGAVAQQETVAQALQREAEKYRTHVTIPATVSERSDITALVAQLKPGQAADAGIAVQYRQRDENTYVVSDSPANRYTLAQRNAQPGKVSENVVLLFTQNGQTATQTVQVEIQGTQQQAPVKELLKRLQERYRNPAYEDSLSDWIAFDLGAYAGEEGFASAAQKNLFVAQAQAKIRPNYPTDYERVALMMTAQGVDASALIEQIAAFPQTAMDSVNAQAFALLAYDAANYALPKDAVNTRQSAIAYLLAHQNADGGWSYDGSTSDASMTSMVLSALAPYRGQRAVEAAITQGVDCLSTLQDAGGGFVSWGTRNSNDAAMVTIALTSLGIDAGADSRFVKNGHSVLENLLSFATADGQFGHDSNAQADAFATEQGFRALIAYSRYRTEGYHLYRFEGALCEPVQPGTITVTIQADGTLPQIQWPEEDVLIAAALTQEDWAQIGSGANAQIVLRVTAVTQQQAQQALKTQLAKEEALAAAWLLQVQKTVGTKTTQDASFRQPIPVVMTLTQAQQGHALYTLISPQERVQDRDAGAHTAAFAVQHSGLYALAVADTVHITLPQTGERAASAYAWGLLALSVVLCLAAATRRRRA